MTGKPHLIYTTLPYARHAKKYTGDIDKARDLVQDVLSGSAGGKKYYGGSSAAYVECTTNLSTGALGFFGACAAHSRTATVNYAVGKTDHSPTGSKKSAPALNSCPAGRPFGDPVLRILGSGDSEAIRINRILKPGEHFGFLRCVEDCIIYYL